MKKRIRILVTFFTVLSILMFSISSYSLLRRHVVIDWVSIQGSLQEAFVAPRVLSFKRSHGIVYEIRFKYTYEVNGVAYKGMDYGVLDRFSSEADAEEAAFRYVEDCGGIVPVLYNMKNFEDSFIVSPGRDMETLVLWSVCLFYLVIYFVVRYLLKMPISWAKCSG